MLPSSTITDCKLYYKWTIPQTATPMCKEKLLRYSEERQPKVWFPMDLYCLLNCMIQNRLQSKFISFHVVQTLFSCSLKNLISFKPSAFFQICVKPLPFQPITSNLSLIDKVMISSLTSLWIRLKS